MSSFTPIPLGQRIPDCLHAVSCSLPTMQDVIGYEERDPETHRHLSSGYPRFVVHPLLRKAALVISERLKLGEHHLWLTSSASAARALCEHLSGSTVETFVCEGVHGVHLPACEETSRRAKAFLQNTGTFLSSRQAEDFLVHMGEIKAPAPETLHRGNSRHVVVDQLLQAYPQANAEDVFLSPSGMNAIHATLRAAASLQAERGRRRWVQLGWLYLDTIALLQRHLSEDPDHYRHQVDVLDLDGLRDLFSREGDTIAGVFAEVPTNPLIQTPDLPAVARLCREHGAMLIVDPTIACGWNLDVLSHADVVVNSLTKYTASGGDVLLGAVVVNPLSPFAPLMRDEIPAVVDPVYPRDLDRLAIQIGETAGVVEKINQNLLQVVAFLESHPRVKSVHWALQAGSRENYLSLARNPNAVGSMVTFSFDGPLEKFHDRTPLPKGPSFGMKTTLICPFMYLAHYDLVTSDEGRAKLQASGLDPELLRLSVGIEPASDIIAALRAGLDD